MTHLEKLKKQRRSLHYSQEFIANQLGISQKAYSDIENGKSTLKREYITKLAELLEIQISELCYISASCNNPCNSQSEELKTLLVQHGIEIPEHLQ